MAVAAAAIVAKAKGRAGPSLSDFLPSFLPSAERTVLGRKVIKQSGGR